MHYADRGDRAHSDSGNKNGGSSHSLIGTHQTANEHADVLAGWHAVPKLNIVHLLYDITPADLISVVVTEVGSIPCSSVPVVVREQTRAFR